MVRMAHIRDSGDHADGWLPRGKATSGEGGLESVDSVLAYLELVPVGVREPEDCAPLFLLDRPRDLDAVLAEPCLLFLGVLRREEVSRVPFLGAGIGAKMQPDIR